MTTFNVCVPVVDLVDADSPDQARAMLVDRLERAGFELLVISRGTTEVNIEVTEAD